MITSHLLREQGGASVRAAVSAFEAHHTHGGAEPDRERAEQHLVLLAAVIAGAWLRPEAASRAAEREAVHVLLAVGDVPGHRCPVCVRPQALLPEPTAGAGGDMTDDERAEHEARLRGLLYLSCPDAPAGAGGDMTDDERAEHEARLRGLLYLSCPDAPAGALEATAEAITRSAGRVPAAAVPEAADLARPRQPYSADPLNLCGADLRGAALMGADLRHADAYGADLSGADLTGADLSHANLTGVDLSHAHLTGANLTDANLSDAQLSHANMNGAVLRDAALTDTDLRSALLCGVDLTGADLTYADLADAHLRGAVLTGADLSDVVLTGADLSEAVLTGSTLEDATIPCPDHR